MSLGSHYEVIKVRPVQMLEGEQLTTSTGPWSDYYQQSIYVSEFAGTRAW